tara:strand:+ start:718 stop:999 length:282 start_codon:yes stop_codon:yes gene_type:complete
MEKGEFVIPVPLGVHLKTVDDSVIIEDVSTYEARKEHFRWTINSATIAYYNALLAEWKLRHGNDHLPRKLITRDELLYLIPEEIGVWDDQIEI